MLAIADQIGGLNEAQLEGGEAGGPARPSRISAAG